MIDIDVRAYNSDSARYDYDKNIHTYWLIYDLLVFPWMTFSIIPLLNVLFSIPMGITFFSIWLTDLFWFQPTYYTIA
jgi:hypothetical protein